MAALHAVSEELDEESPKAKRKKKEGKKNLFRWTDEKCTSFIECLSAYIVSCEYNNVDFDAEKAA